MHSCEALVYEKIVSSFERGATVNGNVTCSNWHRNKCHQKEIITQRYCFAFGTGLGTVQCLLFTVPNAVSPLNPGSV